ncbi:stage VI sporulation protein D [Calidifontibacillus oryziterrae]|uniref:stage VI sporulation protein D n=1 Tax=Calidifontibacillus oryziterrae TaxID=1191699 RepID=UPI00037B428B|nr:stage VI sporulation protein D [Calidifontibacillus oryziterrae]
MEVSLYEGGEFKLTFNHTSSIRFSVEESVWFKKGQEVSDLLSMSLDPEISIQEHENYISIRGALVLTGDYYPKTTDGDSTSENDLGTDFYRDISTVRTIDEILEKDGGIHCMKHRFPVDITIPTNRVRSLEDVYVLIESFDYELPEQGRLELKADLAISGIVNEKTKGIATTENETVRNDDLETDANENRTDSILEAPATEATINGDQNKIVKEQKITPFIDYFNRASGEYRKAPVEKFPSFTTEVRKEVVSKKEITNGESNDAEPQLVNSQQAVEYRKEEKVDEATNQAILKESVTQIEEKFTDPKMDVESRESKKDEVHTGVVVDSNENTPQIGVKGRSENQAYAWNPKSLYSSEQQQIGVAAKEEMMKEDNEAPKKSSVRSENALYLTKMLSSEGEQDFSKLRMRIVQQGDTLSNIAASYEISVSQIIRLNGLTDDIVEEGQILYIPEYAGVD